MSNEGAEKVFLWQFCVCVCGVVWGVERGNEELTSCCYK